MTGAMRTAPRVFPVRLAVTAVLAALAAVLLVWPQALGLQRSLIVAQLVAFRVPVALTLGVGAVVCAIVAWRTRAWGIAAALAVVLAVAGVASGAVVGVRSAGGVVSAGAAADRVSVLAWNTQGGAVAPEAVARAVSDAGADIVSLPETDDVAVQEIARLLAAGGRPMAAFTTFGQTGYSEIPTSVLVSESLGEYRVDEAAGSTPGLPSVVLRPVGGTGPTIVAAHPFPPLPWAMSTWRSGLDWVADRCDAPDVIVAGDLNATVDHLSGLGADGVLIGSCTDAALAGGAAAVGTWPASVPPWLASPIDHVLVGSAWTVREARVITSLDDAGSDHRPLLAVLDRR